MSPVRSFRIVYAFLTLNFVLPAISYIVAPGAALASMNRINAALGGAPDAFTDAGHVWHMLAVGNVMTLGFLCGLLWLDLRRFYPALPALAFLKGFSALYSLAIGAAHGLPAFYAVFVLDGTTTAAMIFFAVRAHRALGPEEPSRAASAAAPDGARALAH
jgi:hypothetical protein